MNTSLILNQRFKSEIERKVSEMALQEKSLAILPRQSEFDPRHLRCKRTIKSQMFFSFQTLYVLTHVCSCMDKHTYVIN